jgi:uncharacterized protein with GYD domain
LSFLNYVKNACCGRSSVIEKLVLAPVLGEIADVLVPTAVACIIGRIDNADPARWRERALDARSARRFTGDPTNEEPAMAKYLIKASYSAEGIKGVMKGGGTARVDAVKKAIESVSGSVESFYFSFGSDDVYVTVDAPNNVAAAAMACAVGSSGALARYETVVLLTADEIDDATKIAVSYAPPGGGN